MSYVLTSVVIRSTSGSFEPRLRHASKLLDKLGIEVINVNWARSQSELEGSESLAMNQFRLKAPYGAGFSNIVAHLRFARYVLISLREIKPRIIYACDLDTLIPSLVYRFSNPVVVIFDQFDPISARVSNKLLKYFLNIFENLIGLSSDIRVTANLHRVPRIFRRYWIELKNLFYFEKTENFSDAKSKHRLFYGGIIGNDRGLINCVNAIRATNTWQMDIFGQGPARDSLANQLPSNVKMHGVVAHSELMRFARNSDLYAALYDPMSPNNVLTASNKLFEAAQLGIPLLTNKGTGMGEIVEEYQLGWVVTYGSDIEIEKALQECSKMTKAQKEKINLNLSRFYEVESSKQEMRMQLILDRIKLKLNCEIG